MRFSEHFKIERSQAELDFVDIALRRDIKVFIDPHALAITKTPWCEAAHSLAWGFFQRVLEYLGAGERQRAVDLLKHLHEDNRTRLGYSEEEPQGTGFGDSLAEPFLIALERSEAFRTGQIQDLETAALLVDDIGLDIVSDMITNVVREHLAFYTQDQCRLFGVPMDVSETFEVWREDEGWVKVTMELPTDGERAILLVPRSVVRMDLSLKPTQYLTYFLDHGYEAGNPRAIAALEKMVQIIPRKQRGNNGVHREKLYDELDKKGTRKNVMAKITDEFPEGLEGYKNRAREKRPVLTPAKVEGIHPERKEIDLSRLLAEMCEAERNADDVMELARTLTGASLAAFHPFFQHPRLLQNSINGFAGVVMSNVAPRGTFWSLRRRGREDAPNVVILASTSSITDKSLNHFDANAVRTSTASGALVLIGTDVDRSVLRRRAELTRRGMVVVSIPELANITDTATGPDDALGVLEALIAA